MEVPEGRGKGVFWWEPAGSRNIDMRSFFDEEGNSLPVLTVFDKYTRPSLKKK
jgi:arabinogalactan endo-1,4-beta-galactosidase